MDTVDLFRFKTTEQMETMMHDDHKRAEMSGELADIFFFLLRFAQMNGFDLAKCLRIKWHIMNFDTLWRKQRGRI